MTDDFEVGRLIKNGIFSLAMLIIGFGGWASLTQISSAVTVAAVLDAGDQKRSLEHPQGGKITAIHFDNGALVQKGDVIATLDGQTLVHEHAIRQSQKIALLAQKHRLIAQRDGADLHFGTALQEQAHQNAKIAQTLDHEAKLFIAQRILFEQNLTQLKQQMDQANAQTHGIDAQIEAVSTQLQLQRARYEKHKALFEKGLTTNDALSNLVQNLAALDGNLARLQSARSETLSRIEQLKVEASKAQTDRIQTAIANIAQIELRLSALEEELAGLETALNNLAIRAPMEGIIHGLDPSATGSVLRPGTALAQILPLGRAHIAVAQLAPQFIDQIAVGQPVTLRFADIDPRNAPEAEGVVKLVSADAVFNERTGLRFYRVEISITDGPENLQPGKTAEAFLHTAKNTPLAYLTDPFFDYFRNTFIEG
ncbi:MAG: HlyD family type I secretion periplasmic adaptor subunit [Planktomarina sp.]